MTRASNMAVKPEFECINQYLSCRPMVSYPLDQGKSLEFKSAYIALRGDFRFPGRFLECLRNRLGKFGESARLGQAFGESERIEGDAR